MHKEVKLNQISNLVYADSFLDEINIETKILPNPYYDLPYLIISDFFDEALCNKITNEFKKKNDYIQAKIRKKDSINKLEEKLDSKIRNTKLYKLTKKQEKTYNEKFLEHQNQIESFFNFPLTISTEIQVLEYTEGDFYKAHSDDSNMLIHNGELIGFTPVAKNRKLTTVLFTSSYNEDKTSNSFTGGELLFNFLYDENKNQIKIKAKKGDMLIFLSNPYFTHEVLPIKSGYRLTLVQWHDGLLN